jgi:hypothetical protein
MCGGQERCIQGLVEKPVGKRPLLRPGRRCGDNIKTDLHEVGGGEGEGMAWIDLDQDTDRWRDVVNAVMNLRIP